VLHQIAPSVFAAARLDRRVDIHRHELETFLDGCEARPRQFPPGAISPPRTCRVAVTLL
jgi:hypothetical protein